MSNTFEYPGRFRATVPGNIDDWYGPYVSIAAAIAAIPVAMRELRVVGITTGGVVFDYWWPGADLSITGLIKKSNEDVVATKENLSNKQNSLAVDGTGNKYPTVDAVNLGLGLKVDKVTGKQLSDENYTSTEKTKLANLSEHYVGYFASLASLQAAFPTGIAGQYATVDSGIGVDADQYVWDNTDSVWVLVTGPGNVLSINGQVGAVTLSTDNIGEGSTNKYFTDTRVATYSDTHYIQSQFASKQIASAWVEILKADQYKFTEGYFDYSSLASFPVYHKTSGSSLNINTAPSQNLNLSLASNSALTISGANHWGVSFQPSTTGPDFGTDIGGFSYRQPTESMVKNFFLFRGGQYVFESDDASWQLIITPSGANFGSPADNALVPMSRLEVDGGLSVGHANARHFAAPSNGLMVQGPAIFGLTSVINVNDAVAINGRTSITGDIYQTGQDNYTVEPTYTSLTKITKGYGDATYATIAAVAGKVSSVTGTANQVIVGGTATNPILSLPQSINSGASPTFNGLTLGATLTTSGLIRQTLSNGSGDIAEFINTSSIGYGAYIQGGNDLNFALKVTGYSGSNAMTVLGNGNTTFAGSVTTPAVNSTAAQTTVAGSTSGSIIASMPFQGASFKKVIINCQGLNGTATYTFPTAFNFVPVVVTNATIISALSTTSVTINNGATAWVILEGY